MSFFTPEMIATLGGEGLERSIHTKVSGASGLHGKTSAFVQAFNDSEIVKKFKTLGIDTANMSIVAAAMIEETDILNKVFPDNAGPLSKGIKLLLKKVAPHLLIGLGTGIADAANVDAHITKHLVSSDSTPIGDRKAPFDVVFLITHHAWTGKARWYVLSRDAAKEILHFPDNDKIPICDSNEYLEEVQKWLPLHGPRTETRYIPDGKDAGGKDKKRKIVDAIPGEALGTIVPFSVIVNQLSPDSPRMGEDQFRAVQAMVAESKPKPEEKPKPWSEKIHANVHEMMFALSVTLTKIGMLEHDLAQDFLEDIPGKDVIMVNKLAEKMVLRIQPDGTFKGGFLYDDLLIVLSYVSTWVGAKLKPLNRFRLAFSYMRASMKNGSATHHTVLEFFGATAPLWFVLILYIVLFICASFLFITGALHSATRMVDFGVVSWLTDNPLDLWFTKFDEGRWSAFGATYVGAMMLYFLFKSMKWFSYTLTSWVELFHSSTTKDQLIAKSSSIAGIVAVFGALIADMVLVGSNPAWRFVVPVAILGMLGVAEWLATIGFGAVIVEKVYAATKWFSFVVVISPLVIAIVFGLIFPMFDITPDTVWGWLKDLWKFQKTNPLFAAVVGGSLVAIAGYFIRNKVEWTKSILEGKVYERFEANWFMRAGLIALFLVAVIHPFVEMPKNKVLIQEPETAAMQAEKKEKEKKKEKQAEKEAEARARRFSAENVPVTVKPKAGRSYRKSDVPGLCDGLSETGRQGLDCSK